MIRMSKEETQKQKEGWLLLANSRKWHYFISGRSLCREWMVIRRVDYELGNDDSPDNCKICQKKLAKLKAKEKGEK